AAVRADRVKGAAKLAASSTVGGVERLARTDRRHAATTDEWDADIWLINTPGGVVDLRTGRMRPHDRADRMTKIASATLVPGSSCPIWRGCGVRASWVQPRPNRAGAGMSRRSRRSPGVRVVHRGKPKRLTAQERKQLKRRQAIEPIIGHLKADHRMDRCHLKGEYGDRLHAVLCATGYNIKWLLRMIAKKGVPFLRAIFL